ncbi:MAG TPA: hypothetical protein VN660_13735 [Steroidobacteraceae bacterium]|nr:hypothetical protein [Steroidobacteraceae bacterium]
MQQLTAMQIVNRVMAALLAAIIAPQLAKLDVHLTPEQYATLAATLATIAFGVYHHFELLAAASPPAVTNSQLAAVVRAVVAELRQAVPTQPSPHPENPGSVSK